MEDYVREEFSGTSVSIEVIKGQTMFEQEYPCLAAVNRAAAGVDRHDGRVIWLTYEPEGKVEKTVMLVGKGITYDTGGADIKAGGVMAGMSRDKCGAADVAGILKVVSILKPKNVKVVAAMAMVRNSVGRYFSLILDQKHQKKVLTYHLLFAATHMCRTKSSRPELGFDFELEILTQKEEWQWLMCLHI